MVIVDTCIWSEAFRKKAASSPISERLKKLIQDGQVVLLNPIRQEILSGIKSSKTFNQLATQLRAFTSPPLDEEIYELAAGCFNQCRRKGIQGSNTDFLICAAALHYGHLIFTTDKDFSLFKRILKIQLLS